ncbi:PD-(D/E)XK nuclease family protein [Dolichospermum sp. ST_sed7]|nr:PD-(D/E)XK nuclease family protein [Dolichospermum sp. ST_sed7]
MLGNTGDKESLQVWKDKVGEEEAARISNVAAHLGEQYHQLGEDWLNGKPLSKVNPISTQIFAKTRPILEQHVTKVHAVEAALVTEVYGLAGRVDAVVDWDGELHILDFKLLKHHNKSWLSAYWIQTAIYAQCWYEMYGVMPKRSVLVVGNKEEFNAAYFTSRVKPWERKLISRVNMFKELIDLKRNI